MMSLLLGVLAALAWGVHDLCVRHVSQNTGIFASLLAVLLFGTVLVMPISIWAWEQPRGDSALTLGLVAGVCFGLAAIAHYKALSIGPVRLVAPIIGAYPALSIGWAVWNGTQVSGLQWLAVLIIISGVGYVARSSDTTSGTDTTASAIVWAVLAGSGFALTFAVGQAAVENGGELFLLGPTRVAALITVLVIAVAGRVAIWPGTGQIKILATIGALDAIALGCVHSAGAFESPELASVVTATFGLITIMLAAVILRERISNSEWTAVLIVFLAIGYLAS